MPNSKPPATTTTLRISQNRQLLTEFDIGAAEVVLQGKKELAEIGFEEHGASTILTLPGPLECELARLAVQSDGTWSIVASSTFASVEVAEEKMEERDEVLLHPGAVFKVAAHEFELQYEAPQPPPLPHEAAENTEATKSEVVTPSDQADAFDTDEVVVASAAPAVSPSFDPNSSATDSPDVPVTEAAPPAAPSEALPNGMVGSSYRVEIDFYDDEPTNAETQFSDEIGLKLVCEDGKYLVTGIPTKDGDHTFAVVYDSFDQPKRQRAYRLFINPDPRSLWKNLPPDATKPYQKEIAESDLLAAEESVLMAASVRGRSHAHEGTFRDDHFRLDSKDGWNFIAVSDGAGSAKYSRKGSEIACETARQEVFERIDILEDLLKDQPAEGIENAAKSDIKNALYSILGNAGKAVFERISEEAKAPSEGEATDAKTSDYAATIIYTAYKRFKFGWFITAFAIGDGGIAVYQKNGEVKVLNKPDGGEYAGQTRFATMPHIWESDSEISTRIQVHVVDDFTAIMAMTDGVSDPKFETDNNFFDTTKWHEFWDDLNSEVDFASSKPDEMLLSWLDFWSAGNHDDRTIAIGLPRNG